MQNDTQITIRNLIDADVDAIRELAERDSATAPALPLLGAIQGDRLIAALPLSGKTTEAIADPFSSTSEAIALLRMRAAQIRGDSPASPRRHLRRRSRPRARGALAGSPPGAAGQLLRL